MKQQIFLIHGGDVWETYEGYLAFLKRKEVDFEYHGLRKAGWQENLAGRLGNEFQVIRPQMPSNHNARYEEWRIWLEKFFPFLDDEVILVGSSLGGTFLAKYLAESQFPKKIKAVFLIAACFDDLPEEPLLDFSLPDSLKKIQSQSKKIILYQSKDDNVVPFSHLAKFQKALPKATVRIFEDRGHFNQEELPELVEDIKKL
jgi:hypothetical protein